MFASLARILGSEISARLHSQWRQCQADAVRTVLADRTVRVWVAEADGAVTGFVAATLHQERLIGEIVMLAVDPAGQNRGAGTALTEFATGWLRAVGMRVAMVDTGGDDVMPPRAASTGKRITPCSG